MDAKPAGPAACCGDGSNAPQQGVFLPVSILMIAVLLFLGWELYLTKSQGAGLKNVIRQREQLVNRARGIKTELNKIVSDLASIAPTNPEANALLQKYQITTKQKP